MNRTGPTHSQQVLELLFDWERFSDDELVTAAHRLPPKLARWLGTHHPDNRIRQVFFRASGVTIGADVVITPGLVVNDGLKGLCTIEDGVSIATNVTLVADSAPNN